MRRYAAVALVSLAGFAAVLCATLLSSDNSVGRWGHFYAWKAFSGKAHGGRRIDVGDANLYYETFGAGSPVLVLHSGLGSLEGMSNQIRALAKSHFVVAVDSRGHGRSTGANAPLSYSLMSNDMMKVLDHLRLDRVDVVGWSDGGVIGLDLAMRHPERVRRLVAIGANYDVDGLMEDALPVGYVPRMPFRYWLLAPDPSHWPALYREVATMWRTQPHYTLVELSHITAPTLVMAGQHDIVKREHTDQLAKAIPGSRESIIAGATHSVTIDKPDIVDQEIIDFLE